MIPKITEKEIKELYEKYKRKYEGRKEDYFAVLYLSKRFNLSPEDVAENYVAFGGNDYGIDAFYFDRDTGNLYLYQFKWSEDHMLFKESFKRLAKDGLERIFGNLTQDPNQNQVIIKLKSCILENKNIIKDILIHFVFNGDPEKAEQSKVLESLREDLESKTYLINEYFGRKVGFVFQYISARRALSGYVQKKVDHKYQIECENTLKFQSQENELIITFIPLSKLLEMYNDLGEKFFSKNIRSGLGEGKETNRKIKETLRKIIAEEELAENFTFYHNGVSLTAEQLELTNNSLVMIEPRILNGAQTMMTLKKFVEDHKTDERIQNTLPKIKVLARIIKSSKDEFLTSVTINNNRQNPIKPWNLRAHDEIQLHFEDKFRELGIYYERRENAFENLTDEELEEMGITEGKCIEITKFAQTLLALQGEVDKTSISEVFENENYYKKTFKEKYLEADTRKLVLLYKIQFRLSAVMNEIKNRGEEKYYYVHKTRNLLWALLIQGLLNDKEFDSYVENYGERLIIEGDFTELLKDIGSNRIRFIFSETFSKGKYREYLEEEKYSFLKSKIAYQDCMKTAWKLYKWEKKDI